ncbi:hypothetical protein GCM10010174_61180 [Kutzneria viridogrisea]|uniref:Uncharacterized protein n=1 Tax=Kutzneria viridogrisea TaxID=47990 RepID=A0ABR6BGF0_9PSEU|nr:hypothetical protein [Kutzneria viridogrisea]
MAELHWHGFYSAVDGNTIKPGGQPERSYGDPSFQSNEIVPNVTHHWLYRSRQVKGTFREVSKATEWLAQQYAQNVAPLLPREPVVAPLDVRLDYASKMLPAGTDVVWGFWLSTGRFASVNMICCPNRDGDAPCPTGGRV